MSKPVLIDVRSVPKHAAISRVARTVDRDLCVHLYDTVGAVSLLNVESIFYGTLDFLDAEDAIKKERKNDL